MRTDWQRSFRRLTISRFLFNPMELNRAARTTFPLGRSTHQTSSRSDRRGQSLLQVWNRRGVIRPISYRDLILFNFCAFLKLRAANAIDGYGVDWLVLSRYGIHAPETVRLNYRTDQAEFLRPYGQQSHAYSSRATSKLQWSRA